MKTEQVIKREELSPFWAIELRNVGGSRVIVLEHEGDPEAVWPLDLAAKVADQIQVWEIEQSEHDATIGMVGHDKTVKEAYATD